MKLEVEGLEFSYQQEKVLENIELKVDAGQILGIIGPNGSGKSTLLKCINGILEPDTGEIWLNGNNLAEFSRNELAQNIGYVPQKENRKFPANVFDTVLLGRKPYISWKPTEEDLTIVAEIIDMLCLESISMRDVNCLSGGQRQKVMIGRALAQQPEVMLLDEPTSELDLKHQLEVLNVVKAQVAHGVSAIMAIHDLSLAGRYCDKVVMLDNGQIFDAGGLEILTPKNIESVYDVKVSIKDHRGSKLVIPEEPIA
ncbi:ABC transporter ATP-binding protein [Natroniella acetigena]|uniref:ABC transporter ATP-binding protein n=1 Tax=Natroniella acetigena TaxID=52004 RepID=UPI00200A8612|nr:ABC transporter ATP-binding protein [Natroniella acetigena]